MNFFRDVSVRLRILLAAVVLLLLVAAANVANLQIARARPSSARGCWRRA